MLKHGPSIKVLIDLLCIFLVGQIYIYIICLVIILPYAILFSNSILNIFISLQVRFGQILENGQVDTKSLVKHQGRVHKLAIEPGNPHIFYSCGEDGVVQHVGHYTVSGFLILEVSRCQMWHLPCSHTQMCNVCHIRPIHEGTTV